MQVSFHICRSLFTYAGLFPHIQVSFHICRSLPTYAGLFSHLLSRSHSFSLSRIISTSRAHARSLPVALTTSQAGREHTLWETHLPRSDANRLSFHRPLDLSLTPILPVCPLPVPPLSRCNFLPFPLSLFL